MTALPAPFALKILALLVSISAVSHTAQSAPYRPEALRHILDRVVLARTQDDVPIALFDIDDTLLETQSRTGRILAEFAALPSIRNAYPEESEILARLPRSSIRYELSDTFVQAGIHDSALLELAATFWKARFFSSAYCAGDTPIADAAPYVRALHVAGAVIVYLTGRPRPEMEQGTRFALARYRFPLNDAQGSALLFMKPSAEMDDLSFKKAAFETIARIGGPRGRVVGVFENEPANLNAMQARFPDATAVFLDTVHSKRPDVPSPEAYWVPNFRAGRR